LIKGSNFIDKICRLNTVIFDKTGTLTQGTFAVTEVVTRNGFNQQNVLKYAAYAESQSNHPIALSIKQAFKRDIDEKQILKIEEIAGLGVKALLKNHDIIVGNDKFLHRERVIHEDCSISQTVLYVVVDKKYAGYIIISDKEKTDARQAVIGLKKMGISKIGMLTGDSRSVAEYYAEKLGLDSYQSELLPVQKLEYIKKIRENDRARVAFVGDGINDAPVIAGADVGIAMGRLGSDAAIETADVVLMTDAPSKVIEAIKISKRTRRIVIENIILALSIKLIFIVFGVGSVIL
jgi:Cd2+/Zn2+-exporting ATPase